MIGNTNARPNGGLKQEDLNKINSNTSKPLDTHITEQTNAVKNILNNSTYGLSAIKNALGSGGVIKSVQRGVANLGYTFTATNVSSPVYAKVNISNVNIAKCIILIDGAYTMEGTNDYIPYGIYLKSATNTSLEIGTDGTYRVYVAPGDYYIFAPITQKFSWQVIEFY